MAQAIMHCQIPLFSINVFTLAYALNIITLYYLSVSDAWIYDVC